MEATADKIHFLTGREFFKPKGNRALSLIFSRLLKLLENKTVVLVGGTNGKGETCYSLEWCANELGLSNTVFTSPHLFKVHERIRFNGKNISEEDLSLLLKQFENEYELNSCELSYFELCFWLFLKYTIDKDPDIIICEVGLGGRLDITNLLSPSVSVITNISRDHIEFLGNSYKKILNEKLGITREGVKLFTGVNTDYLKGKVIEFSEKNSVPVQFVEPKKNYSLTNKWMALSVFKFLFRSKFEFLNKEMLFRKTVDPRVKVFNDKGGSGTYFYGAHNLDGHRNLLKYLSDKNNFDTIILNFSNRPVSEIKSIIKVYLEWVIPQGKIFINTNDFFKCSSKLKLNAIIEEFETSKTTIISSKVELETLVKEKRVCLWVGSYYSCELLNEIFD